MITLVRSSWPSESRDVAAAIGSKLYIWGGYRANCKLSYHSDNVLDELDSYQKSVVGIQLVLKVCFTVTVCSS